jgi:hypothetical protein
MTAVDHARSLPSSADPIASQRRLWDHLAELLAAQREAIISRDHDALADISDRLHAHCRMLQAPAEHALSVRPTGDDPLAALADLQIQVRAAAQVNHELIADALACTDMMLQLLCPALSSPVYDQRGQLGDRTCALSLNRSA